MTHASLRFTTGTFVKRPRRVRFATGTAAERLQARRDAAAIKTRQELKRLSEVLSTVLVPAD
jgi:hypothetical protein